MSVSIPLPGTYRIRSVKFPNQMFDLQGGSHNRDTPIIGYGNNYNTQNMLWTLQVVDKDNKVVRLVNVASGTFAQFVAPEQAGATVVGSPDAALFKIIPRNNLGEYAIQTTDGHYACSLADDKNYTHVKLQKVDGKDNSQGWIFCPP